MSESRWKRFTVASAIVVAILLVVGLLAHASSGSSSIDPTTTIGATTTSSTDATTTTAQATTSTTQPATTTTVPTNTVPADCGKEVHFYANDATEGFNFFGPALKADTPMSSLQDVMTRVCHDPALLVGLMEDEPVDLAMPAANDLERERRVKRLLDHPDEWVNVVKSFYALLPTDPKDVSIETYKGNVLWTLYQVRNPVKGEQPGIGQSQEKMDNTYVLVIKLSNGKTLVLIIYCGGQPAHFEQFPNVKIVPRATCTVNCKKPPVVPPPVCTVNCGPPPTTPPTTQPPVTTSPPTTTPPATTTTQPPPTTTTVPVTTTTQPPTTTTQPPTTTTQPPPTTTTVPVTTTTLDKGPVPTTTPPCSFCG
jgi:hypothetical protein